MKPIIKWPGGKSRELARFRERMPAVTTLVEPFVGGGAMFFDLEPEAAFINDASADLMGFYRAVREGDAAFRAGLDMLAADRVVVSKRAVGWAEAFSRAVALARKRPAEAGAALLGTAGLAEGLGLPAEGLQATLTKSVTNKIRRLLGLEAKHERVFSPEELPDHFETALQAGYYTAVRDAWAPADRAGQIARFYFLRVMCYGSMFRYGKDGRFNIPYGGISYNRVDLAGKAERLFDPAVRGLLARAEIDCLDFEAHLHGVRDRLDGDAFVFLDPPYDTEFSDYANQAFGRVEQERLARVFAALPCPALMVIQGTDFIRGLYERVGAERERRGEPFFVEEYAKTYGYNVRGRNERNATHLLIANYAQTPQT